jgi:hypothetical protein
MIQFNFVTLFDAAMHFDLEFLKKDTIFLKYFYLMMPKKTCSCPNKPRVRSLESEDKAYEIYLTFKDAVSKDFFNEFKSKLDNQELQFLDKEDKILFKI